MSVNARKDFPENPPAPRWPIALYGSIALAGLLLAFVGLSTSSYWVDELFTLYVVDPQVDVAEIMQRILRDVHPPLYYLVLDGWSAVFGQSEAATRSLSAICGVLAVLVFAWGARHVARPLAIAFACAVATTSVFWFEQAQNARSYAFLMLLTAGLLAAALHLRRRTRESSAFPFAAWLTLTLLGLAASQTHSYLLLGTGVLLLYLIATLPELRLRLALVASGVVTLGAYVLFLWFQLHATTHDFGASWFRGDFDFIQRHIMRAMRNGMSRQAMLIAGVLLLVLLVRKWRRRGEPAESRADDDANWAAGLGAFVIVGGIAAGIAVTKLFTPSFSFRNVLTFVPFAWLLLARLYDVAGPRARTRAGTAAVVLIAALLGWQQVVLARGRALPRNEPWRESAEYVRELTACAASPLPGLALPEAYGGLSSGGRALVADYYHGHYLPAEVRTQILTPPEISQRYLSAPAHSGDACPLIAWNVHALGEARALTFAAALADLPAFRGSGVAIQEFAQYSQDDFSWRAKQEGFVFLRADAEVRTLPRADRILVRRIDEAVQQERKTFLIERWRGGERIGEQRMSVPADALGVDPLREWRKIAKKE